MSERELICIGCPMGCPIVVKMEDGKVTSVTGNTCPRGEAYARKEVTDPRQSMTFQKIRFLTVSQHFAA